MNPETSANDRLVDRVSRWKALDALADIMQPLWRSLLDPSDPVRALASDALHGTWIGHSLHPLLTDIPIGAWTVGAAADLLALGGDERMAYAADVAMTIGVLGASGAALAGWADWSDTKEDPRRLGIAHAALNGAALALYLASLALRRTRQRGLGTLTGLAGYGFVTAGAYLGGELSLGMQLGVKHTAAPIDPDRAFVRVANAADVPADGTLRVVADGIPLIVSRVGDVVHAVAAVCTHRGAPLDEGTREGDCVRCPWHGSRFTLDDGSVVQGPTTFPLAAWETRIVDGALEVRVA